MRNPPLNRPKPQHPRSPRSPERQAKEYHFAGTTLRRHPERSEPASEVEGSAVKRSLGRSSFFVYILTNHNHTLYVGVTNDLIRRLAEHKLAEVPGFTARYGLDRLVYVEEYASVAEAIAREKQLKNWSRQKKIALINCVNPEWDELRM